MRTAGRVIACAFVTAVSVVGLSAGEAVVLQGGARIELKKPPVRRGDVLLLTRSDGVLLTVHAADIDWKATAAAGSTTQAPSKDESAKASPERPAQAMRAGRDGPKARVKLTDADVAHVAQEQVPGEKERKGEARAGAARSTVPEYAQQAGGMPILYDFTADWCPPCHRLDTEGSATPRLRL